MGDLLSTTAGLWLAVVASGLYHGLNPGMGWPLAVSAALMERSDRAFFNALGALALGHFLAMLAILLPFSAMTLLIEWQRELRVAAGAIVIALGVWLLFVRRHPRFLARIPPARLALWSFLVAIAHGAALMLVPIYLGLSGPGHEHAGHHAASELMTANLGLSLLVATIHTCAMIAAGGAIAFSVYRWLGLSFLSRTWFDLELVWALSLVLVGALGIATAI